MNVPLMQQIASHDLHERIEDMAERHNYHSHMAARKQIANSAYKFDAFAHFQNRSIAQRERWIKFNQINRRTK